MAGAGMNSPPGDSPLRPPLVFLMPIALGLLLLATPAAPAAEPEPKPAEEKKPPEVLAEFKIEKGCRPIILPVTVKGKDYKFLLDTGCGESFFDTSFKPKRGLFDDPPEAKQVSTPGGNVQAEKILVGEASVGPLRLRESSYATCFDLEVARHMLGQDVRGFIGMDFLKKHVVRLDFDAGKVLFLRSDGGDHPDWGEAVPIQYGRDRTPRVPVKMPGAEQVVLQVDTGSFTTLYAPPEAFQKIRDGRWIVVPTTTMGGVTRSREGRIEELALGPFRYRDLLATESKVDPGLGLGLLARHVVTFDFPKDKLYLRKGTSFDVAVDERDMSGLNILWVDEKLLVASADTNSPADKAGVRGEDVILKVGDKSAAEMNLWDLRDLLKSGDGKEIKMTIKRGDEEKVVSFKLKKRI